MRNKIAALLLALLLTSLPVAQAAQSDRVLTRGETVTLLLEAAEEYHPGVSAQDILKGYPGGKLEESGSVTRVQALVMLERAFGGLPIPKGDTARSGYPSEQFTDVPDWAKEELKDVFRAGIVAGTSPTTFSPTSPVTEGQLRCFLQRVYALEGSNLKDDFYAAVNKKDLDASEILPGFSSAGAFTDVAIGVGGEVNRILQKLVSGDAKTDGEKQAVTLYQNIVNMKARNKAGISPIQSYLKDIHRAETLSELMAVQNRVEREMGSSLLLGFDLMVDVKDSSQYVLTFETVYPALGQGGYTNATARQKTAYETYVARLLELSGQKKKEAARQAEEIWEADSLLAAQGLPNQEQGNVDKTYHPYTMAQLQTLFSCVDLTEVFAQTGLKQTDQIVITDEGMLKAGAALFQEKNLDLLKAYSRFRLLAQYGPLLSEDFVTAQATFRQNYLGTTGTRAVEVVASEYVQSLMCDTLGQAYVARCFSESAKQEVEGLAQEILAVYRQRIQQMDWMSAATKEKAVGKLETMRLQIGYPDTWEEPYRNAKILSVEQGGSFFANIVAMNKERQVDDIRKQAEGVNRSVWVMPTYAVNACYDPTVNAITFPAGILQAPFYDEAASYEQNLGGIGYIIAHEITHAFDNNGAKYDEKGNAADWWMPEDRAAFDRLCQQVVELYDGRECAPGIVCNGALTLSENIADLGAAACLTELEGQQKSPDFKTLYTAMARIWCSSYPREMKQYLAQGDVHAPDKLRGSLVLQNFQPFYDAFGITEGDGMWLPPEERVVIW